MSDLARDAGRVAVKVAVAWAVWRGLTWISSREREEGAQS